MNKFQEWLKKTADYHVENDNQQKRNAEIVTNILLETHENGKEIIAVSSIVKLIKDFWLIETPEIRKLWEEVSKLMKNWEGYSELYLDYTNQIRDLIDKNDKKNKGNKNRELNREKQIIWLSLLCAKTFINWWKIQRAIELLTWTEEMKAIGHDDWIDYEFYMMWDMEWEKEIFKIAELLK